MGTKPCNYLATLFNFFGFLLFLPFTTKFDEKHEQFEIIPNKFICRVLSALLHLMILCNNLLVNIHIFFKDAESSSITQVFEGVGYLASWVLNVLTLKMVWLDKAKVLHLLQITTSTGKAEREKWVMF